MLPSARDALAGRGAQARLTRMTAARELLIVQTADDMSLKRLLDELGCICRFVRCDEFIEMSLACSPISFAVLIGESNLLELHELAIRKGIRFADVFVHAAYVLLFPIEGSSDIDALLSRWIG